MADRREIALQALDDLHAQRFLSAVSSHVRSAILPFVAPPVTQIRRWI